MRLSPHKVQEIFTYLKCLDPNCIIAGGYVRDNVLGREPKDVDFYLQTSLNVFEFVSMLSAYTRHRPAPEGLRPAVKGESYQHPFKVGVVGMGPEVDIILIAQPVTTDLVFSMFDLGICMAAVTADGRTVLDPRFNSDVMSKTITLYAANKLTEADYEHSKKEHVPRVMEKYPEFRFVEVPA